MSEFKLVIGNQNYSSWSMRGWLAMKLSGVNFSVEKLWLDEDLDRRERLARTPAGRVPALMHGDFCVWDSLAIAEYMADLCPDAAMWPKDPKARARARSVVAEMHSGFVALRAKLPMNCRAQREERDRGPEVAKEVERVAEIWAGCRRDFGSGGDYLFGEYCLADAFYAPVASRFRTYAVRLEGEAKGYCETILAHPDVREWVDAGKAEKHLMVAYEDIQ
ncbi:MAG: glutathione S-transferase family protein [Planctomycetota bacterium]